MSRTSPFQIVLSKEEREVLESPRAKIYVAVFRGGSGQDDSDGRQRRPNDEIAARLDIGREVVSQWRQRFFKERLTGLEERARPGRPRVFPPNKSTWRSRRWRASCPPPWACRCRA